MIGSCNPNISLSYMKYKCFWIRFDHWFPKIQRSRIICPSSLVVFVHTTCWHETWVFLMWTAKSISLSLGRPGSPWMPMDAQAASQVAASLDGREPFSRQKNEAGLFRSVADAADVPRYEIPPVAWSPNSWKDPIHPTSFAFGRFCRVFNIGGITWMACQHLGAGIYELIMRSNISETINVLIQRNSPNNITCFFWPNMYPGFPTTHFRPNIDVCHFFVHLHLCTILYWNIIYVHHICKVYIYTVYKCI